MSNFFIIAVLGFTGLLMVASIHNPRDYGAAAGLTTVNSSTSRLAVSNGTLTDLTLVSGTIVGVKK